MKIDIATISVENDKSARGNAGQFFVAGELCRRGYAAVVTLGSTPNTDILCSKRSGTRFAHIQVKTFVPGRKTCSVGRKAERTFGSNFFWVLAGIPEPSSTSLFEYFIVPSADMADNVRAFHKRWLGALGAKGQQRRDSSVRAVCVPPHSHRDFWTVERYRDRWDYIANVLDA